jgi:hypothetical protein
MKQFFLFLIFITAISCSKEKFPRVEYKVSSSSSAQVSYTMVSATVNAETVSGSWSKSFRHSQGANVFLRATHSGFGSTTISIYVNKELMWTESSNIPGETIQILEVLP